MALSKTVHNTYIHNILEIVLILEGGGFQVK